MEVEVKGRGLCSFESASAKKENRKKERRCSFVNEASAPLFSVWHVRGLLTAQGLPFVNEFPERQHSLRCERVCVCVWLRVRAHVCSERTPLTELRERETEECLFAAGAAAVPVALLSLLLLLFGLLSATVCRTCFRASARVACPADVIEEKDEMAVSDPPPPRAIKKNEGRDKMRMRDYLI